MSEKELSHFQPLQGTDFYQADTGLRSLLQELVPDDSWRHFEEKISSFSQRVSGSWDQLAEETARHYPGPKIEYYDQQGNAIDRIWLPPPVRQLRREVVESGIFETNSQLEKYVKVSLLSHLGETSVTCPLACTEGLVRVIEAVGSDFLKKNYLPRLRSVENPLAGSQFITEQDMGSDVGALTTTAVLEREGRKEEGRWQLFGEKWFCSAVDEFFLIAARPEGAPSGTEGVAIFLVPRTLEGRLNGLRIKRLKEKLGTRELPTAEIDLHGAIGYQIGPVESGFKSLMNYVINTSRIMNAASGCGMMARSCLEAANYARQRSAFGKKIDQYPMVQESLVRMQSILSARRSLFFHLISEMDRHPVPDLMSDEALWRRFLINISKYRTAMGATECAHEAILLLGGNGTIESFSILPRLYRDSLIIETWEGTHNTLALQIVRDGLRFPFREYLSENILQRVEKMRKGSLKRIGDWVNAEWDKTLPALERLSDPVWVAAKARRLIDHLASLLEVSFFAATMAGQTGPTSQDRVRLLDNYCEQISCLPPLN